MNFEKIKQGVEDLRIYDAPSAEEGFWYYLDRYKKSVRYVREDDPLYDIYLKKEIGESSSSTLEVSTEVVLYDLKRQFTTMCEEIFDSSFSGWQPPTQIFLDNLPCYQNQIDGVVENYADIAMHMSENEPEKRV